MYGRSNDHFDFQGVADLLQEPERRDQKTSGVLDHADVDGAVSSLYKSLSCVFNGQYLARDTDSSIVFIALLSISIPLWFPKPKKIEGQDGKDVEMGQAERISSHSK